MSGTALALTVLIAAGAPQSAAPERPRAQLTATAPVDPVASGSAATLALRVQLPDGMHVQSDHPRDANLIPTALTLDVPAGFTVERIVYPKPTDFVQTGQRTPLLVFGHDFTIEIHIGIEAGAAAGERQLSGQLRYQACNDRLCFPPARAAASWPVTVR